MTQLAFMPDSSLVSDVVASPNFGARKNGRAPDMVVLHYTGMADSELAIRRMCDPASEVSAHYLVDVDGRVVQIVPEEARAWHAGESWWAGESDINSCSVGIEIANGGHDWGYPEFPLRQVAAVIALCKGILIRRNIPAHRILAHSDIAPARKKDPGEKFPWKRLYESGVGLWVAPAPIETETGLKQGDEGPQVAAMQHALASYGYRIIDTGLYDAPTTEVVRAFQRHFRPARVDGRADLSTLKTLKSLIAALPDETSGAAPVKPDLASS